MNHASIRTRLTLVFPFVIGCLLLPAQAAKPSVAQSELTIIDKPSAGARRIEKQPRPWLDPDGKPLPFKSTEEVLEFLQTAKVIKNKKIKEGITHPRRLLLEKDGLRR